MDSTLPKRLVDESAELWKSTDLWPVKAPRYCWAVTPGSDLPLLVCWVKSVRKHHCHFLSKLCTTAIQWCAIRPSPVGRAEDAVSNRSFARYCASTSGYPRFALERDVERLFGRKPGLS